jgi:uncharacterized protein (TIGR02246 family)
MRVFAFLLLFPILIAACSKEEEPSAFESLGVRAAIDSLWTGYAYASDQKDSTAFASLFTEDAMIMVSGQKTVQGRDAVASFLVRLYAELDPTGFRVEPDETRVSRTLAAQTGSFQETYIERNEERTRYGRYALIAEQGDKDVWKIRCLTAIVDSTR